MKTVLYVLLGLIGLGAVWYMTKPQTTTNNNSGGNNTLPHGTNPSGVGSTTTPIPPPETPVFKPLPKECKCPDNFKFDGNACVSKWVLPQGAKPYFEGQNMRYKSGRNTAPSDCINGSKFKLPFLGTPKTAYCQLNEKVPDFYRGFVYDGQFYTEKLCEQ